MKQLKQLLTMAFLLTTMLAFGQTKTTVTEEEPQQPYIEVTGTANMEIIPDEIFIGFTIREKYVNRYRVTIEEQEEKLKEAIKTLGIDLANLSLANTDANFVKIRWQQRGILTKREYILKVADATTVGQVFQELEKLEIRGASISKVSHSKMDSLKKEIRILAIKDAKEKADYLLNAIGEQTGKPLVIREDTKVIVAETLERMPGRGVYPGRSMGFSDSNEEENDKDSEIQFQKIKLTSNIYVKFLIK